MDNETITQYAANFEPWNGYIPCSSRTECVELGPQGLLDVLTSCPIFTGGLPETVPLGKYCSCTFLFFSYGPLCNRIKPEALVWTCLNGFLVLMNVFEIFTHVKFFILIVRHKYSLNFFQLLSILNVVTFNLSLFLWSFSRFLLYCEFSSRFIERFGDVGVIVLVECFMLHVVFLGNSLRRLTNMCFQRSKSINNKFALWEYIVILITGILLVVAQMQGKTILFNIIWIPFFLIVYIRYRKSSQEFISIMTTLSSDLSEVANLVKRANSYLKWSVILLLPAMTSTFLWVVFDVESQVNDSRPFPVTAAMFFSIRLAANIFAIISTTYFTSPIRDSLNRKFKGKKFDSNSFKKISAS